MPLQLAPPAPPPPPAITIKCSFALMKSLFETTEIADAPPPAPPPPARCYECDVGDVVNGIH